MCRKTALLVGLGALISFGACTEPKETTAIGAATGGVLGAGLGAIVGSQTGDAGTGLVLGAAAGAGTGAAIGNALQAQQEAIRTQDEALERQEKTIRAQNAELEELRTMNKNYDTGQRFQKDGFRKDAPVAQKSIKPVPSFRENAYTAENRYSPSAVERAIKSRDIVSDKTISVVPYPGEEVRGALRQTTQPLAETDEASRRMMVTKEAQTAECRQAEEEASRAESAAEVSDRLFHYRRALRLCPNSPAYHNALGEVYLSLNRSSDADYEFREALRVDPSFGPARENINALSNRTR